jgi:hypothetical protein
MIAIVTPRATDPTITSARLVVADVCASTTRIESGSAPPPIASSSARLASRMLPYRPITVQAVPSCCSRIATRLNRPNRPRPMSDRLGPGIPGGPPPLPMPILGRYARCGTLVCEAQTPLTCDVTGGRAGLEPANRRIMSPRRVGCTTCADGSRRWLTCGFEVARGRAASRRFARSRAFCADLTSRCRGLNLS